MVISSADALAEAHEPPGERGESEGEADVGEIHHDDDSGRDSAAEGTTMTTATAAIA
jgi:hypothetical protein